MAFRTICHTGARIFSFTVSVPVKVRFATSGAIRIAYSSGTTCFGNFPGVVAKSNGFSAFKVVTKRSEKAAKKTRREASIRPLNNASLYLHLRFLLAAVSPTDLLVNGRGI